MNNRPKLYPPLALLAQVAGPSAAMPAGMGRASRTGTLSVAELRRIVADLID